MRRLPVTPELAELVAEVTGRRAEVLYSKAENGGVSRMCADIRLAADKLNFRPHTNLAEGLRLTVARDPRFEKKTA